MANNNTRYMKLKEELEQLKELADKQNAFFKSSTELLREGLSRVYLWWSEASKEDGLLSKLYDEYNIQYKKQTIHEVQFTPLLRYLWNMDGSLHSNKLDAWNRALNSVHIAVLNDKEFYKTNTLNKLISFIANSGGVTVLAGYVDKANVEDNTATKNKLSKTAEQKLRDAHFVNGKKFFASAAKPIAQLDIKQALALAESGFALALLRKSETGYDVLETINDSELVEQAVIAAYKRNSEGMPQTARLLTEIIRTQTLPSKIAKLSAKLAENSKYKVEDTKEYMKQLRRLLYVAKDGVFILSENRSNCSVVTIATPFVSIFNANNDVALAINDRTYIENNLIHSNDFNFYTADASEYVPATIEEAASYKLKLENNVTKAFRFIRFYDLDAFKFPPSKSQAILKPNAAFTPKYTAILNAKWLSEMNALFLARWVNGYGAKMNRAEHKMLMLALGKTGITFRYNYKAKEYREAEFIDFDKNINANGYLEINLLSKDIISVLNALVQLEIDGDVTLQADEKNVRFTFKTDCADYVVAVPCSDTKAKRVADYFEAYGA